MVQGQLREDRAEGTVSKKSDGAQNSDGTFPAGIAEAANTGTGVTGMGWGGRVQTQWATSGTEEVLERLDRS